VVVVMQPAEHLASGISSRTDVHFRPGQVAAAGLELMLVLFVLALSIGFLQVAIWAMTAWEIQKQDLTNEVKSI
jgi:hypothetical protein